jgi:hypothetical protein
MAKAQTLACLTKYDVEIRWLDGTGNTYSFDVEAHAWTHIYAMLEHKSCVRIKLFRKTQAKPGDNTWYWYDIVKTYIREGWKHDTD